MSTSSVIYFVHSRSQARIKEEGCGRLTASIKFSHSIMNGSTTDIAEPTKAWLYIFYTWNSFLTEERQIVLSKRKSVSEFGKRMMWKLHLGTKQMLQSLICGAHGL